MWEVHLCLIGTLCSSEASNLLVGTFFKYWIEYRHLSSTFLVRAVNPFTLVPLIILRNPCFLHLIEWCPCIFTSWYSYFVNLNVCWRKWRKQRNFRWMNMSCSTDQIKIACWVVFALLFFFFQQISKHWNSKWLSKRGNYICLNRKGKVATPPQWHFLVKMKTKGVKWSPSVMFIWCNM